MPIYEYHCTDCENDFEELVSVSATQNPPCPSCNSTKTDKKMSVFGGLSGSSGGGSSCGGGGFT